MLFLPNGSVDISALIILTWTQGMTLTEQKFLFCILFFLFSFLTDRSPD